MHFRSFSVWSEVESRGGATVAIIPDDQNKTATISIARCNPHDVFCKKTGREIAAGRIRAALEGRESSADKIRVINIEDPMHLKTSVATVLKDEMEYYNLY